MHERVWREGRWEQRTPEVSSLQWYQWSVDELVDVTWGNPVRPEKNLREHQRENVGWAAGLGRLPVPTRQSRKSWFWGHGAKLMEGCSLSSGNTWWSEHGTGPLSLVLKARPKGISLFPRNLIFPWAKLKNIYRNTKIPGIQESKLLNYLIRLCIGSDYVLNCVPENCDVEVPRFLCYSGDFAASLMWNQTCNTDMSFIVIIYLFYAWLLKLCLEFLHPC